MGNLNLLNWIWKIYGDEIVSVGCEMTAEPDSLLRTAAAKCTAVVTVAVAAPTDFHEVL